MITGAHTVLSSPDADRAARAEERWGRVTTLALPGGGELGLYEPKHPRP